MLRMVICAQVQTMAKALFAGVLSSALLADAEAQTRFLSARSREGATVLDMSGAS
jgi:hypothetical protein